MPNLAEIRAKALAHYQEKLASEMARLGVKAIFSDFVENAADVLIESNLWGDLAKLFGVKLVVAYPPDGDVQTVYIIVSDREVAQPADLYKLHRIVEQVTAEIDEDEHDPDMGTLGYYKGPFAMDVSEALAE